MEEAIDAAIKWLEENQDTEAEEYKKEKKQLGDVVQPIISKLYQGQGGPPPSSEQEDDMKDEL